LLLLREVLVDEGLEFMLQLMLAVELLILIANAEQLLVHLRREMKKER